MVPVTHLVFAIARPFWAEQKVIHELVMAALQRTFCPVVFLNMHYSSDTG